MPFFHATNRKTAHVRHVIPIGQWANSRIWANSKTYFFLIFIINLQFHTSNIQIYSRRLKVVNYSLANIYILRVAKLSRFLLFSIYSGLLQPGLFICNQISVVIASKLLHGKSTLLPS